MLKVLCSKEFLVKLNSYLLFTLQEFKESSDIDIESYTFFETLLNIKTTKIHVDLNQEKIDSYITEQLDEIDFDERDIAKIVKCKGASNVVSDTLLFNKLRQKDAVNIEINTLPNYLFLGDVDESWCKEVEQMFGIHCYSTKRMKVPSEFRMVILENLQNTKTALFNKLARHNFHSIKIEDPYFFESNESDDNKASELVKFSNQENFALKNISISIKVDLHKFDNSQYEKKKKSIQDKINKKISSSCKIEFTSSLVPRLHDRLINTNRVIMVLGNSLFTSSETHFTSYPFGIYHDYFD